jgi:hypothetical protein
MSDIPARPPLQRQMGMAATGVKNFKELIAEHEMLEKQRAEDMTSMSEGMTSMDNEMASMREEMASMDKEMAFIIVDGFHEGKLCCSAAGQRS